MPRKKKVPAHGLRRARERREKLIFSASEDGHQLIIIVFLGLTHDDAPVDDAENSAESAGQQLEDSHADVSDHESVDAQASQEERDDENDRRIFHLDRGDDDRLRILGGFEFLFDDREFVGRKIFLLGRDERIYFFSIHIFVY